MERVGRRMRWLWVLVSALSLAPSLRADDVVTKAMRDEMARSKDMRLPGIESPYFVAYRMQDINDISITANLGSLVSSDDTRSRLLHVELRVGSYKLDNTNFLSFANRQFGSFTGQQVTIDDNYNQIRRQIWLSTDAEYKKAVQALAAKQAALQNQSHVDDMPDFSEEHPNKYFEKANFVSVDVSALERAARQISAVFRQMPELQSSKVTINIHDVFTRYLNSEGTEYAKPSAMNFIEIKAEALAEDGLPLENSEQLYLSSPAEILGPDMLSRAEKVVDRLQKLRRAPSLDRYSGPVLFEGEAAPEIVAQLFAPAIVASRTPVTDNPQAQGFLQQMTATFAGGTLNDRVGGRVLPDFLTMVDNPQADSFEGQGLLGRYAVDEDGVPARVNTLVESGILKMVLSSRTPSAAATQSTGSHRGLAAAPSNVIFSTNKANTEPELRSMLLARAKARGNEYGVIVRCAGTSVNEFIQAAMALMQGGGPTGNNLLEVYKLYPDGHEELMHGEQLLSLTAASFKDIVAVGDKPVIYNSVFIPGFNELLTLGLTGDISDVTNMPVTTYVVPSLLFEEATLRKASGPFPKPPVSDPPRLHSDSK